jgi:toxin HigB-1
VIRVKFGFDAVSLAASDVPAALNPSNRSLSSDHFKRLRAILTALEAARTIEGVNMAGFHLHPLKGDREGQWAVTVRANWRITFRFEESKAF